jgi:hypothetical protein
VETPDRRRRKDASDAGALPVRDYVLELTERDQRLPTKREWLERVRRRETVRLDRPVAELIAEDREERDRELAGRSSLHE